MSSKNFLFGLLVGSVVGAAAAYFSDRTRRNEFCDGVTDTYGRAKDSLVSAYEDAKEKYYGYRRKLSGATDELLDNVKDELEELAD